MITVLIADDHPEVRRGLFPFLGVQDDLELIGAADDGLPAVSLAESLKPDIVLMDLKTPGADGYLFKDVDPQALVQAIRAVHDGHVLFAPDAAEAMVRTPPAAGDRGRWRHRRGTGGTRADRARQVRPGDRPRAVDLREDGRAARRRSAHGKRKCRIGRRRRCTPSATNWPASDTTPLTGSSSKSV